MIKTTTIKATGLVLGSILTVSAGFSQSNFNTQRNWSMSKKEITIGFGGTNFLGDLGGANQVGTDYSIKDWDFPSTSLGGSLSYRYRWHPYYSTSTVLNIGMVRGNDANTSEVFRNNRNLHFRSPVINLSQRYELIILANEKVGRRYNIPGLKGFKDKNDQIYLFAGVGVMYYNPKANYNGSWVALQPLHTAGQGLPGGPENYKRVTATLPLGVGMRFGINRLWRVGLEFTYVKTFTDYIDDVSGVYYDPNILMSQYGTESSYLSNPGKTTSWFNPGSLRGDKQKDAIFYANLTVVRNLTASSSTRYPKKFGSRKKRYINKF
jgi:hypothetical protein